MDKSYVSLGQQLCIVCLERYDSGEILIDKRMRNTLEHKTVTGYGMCPEHAKLRDEGYIALVGCDPERSTVSHGQTAKPEDIFRTGDIAHLRLAAFVQIINVPPPANGVCFADAEVIKVLQREMEAQHGEQKVIEKHVDLTGLDIEVIEGGTQPLDKDA